MQMYVCTSIISINLFYVAIINLQSKESKN
jgi:hypothetical protein